MLHTEHEFLQAELGDGSRWGVHLAWSVEGHTAAEALETKGRYCPRIAAAHGGK